MSERTGTRISLGALVVELRGLDFSLSGHKTWLADFICDDEPDVIVEATFGDRPDHEWVSSEILATRVDRERRVADVRLTEWHAVFDLGARHVRAEFGGRWPLAVDSLLKTVLQIYVIELGRGLLFHASSVERHGRAYVFMGRSGAGKTTAALLSREAGATILSEEMTVICGLDGQGELAVPTLPFRQRLGIPMRPARLPLAGLYALEQADEDAVVPLTPAQQVLRLAETTSIGVRDALLMTPALELAGRLTARMPAAMLRFRKPPAVGGAIDES
jgi:hypothetical protein